MSHADGIAVIGVLQMKFSQLLGESFFGSGMNNLLLAKPFMETKAYWVVVVGGIVVIIVGLTIYKKMQR